MMAKRLSSRRLHVCAAPAYLETHGTPHSLSELDKHNCLISSSDVWRFQVGGKTKNIRVSGNIHCNSGYGVMDAALKGIGSFNESKALEMAKAIESDASGSLISSIATLYSQKGGPEQLPFFESAIDKISDPNSKYLFVQILGKLFVVYQRVCLGR